MSRFGAAALAVSVSALAALTALAALASQGVATAASATGQITITQAGPTGPNPYMLTVTADDANGLPLTSMTVHVFSGATEVDTVTDMAYVSGADDAQLWRATAPIAQAELPPGTYTLTVDATDADETDAGLAGPAPFAFSWTTAVGGTAAPKVLTYNETTTTISGRVTGIVPDSSYTAPVGLSGVPVFVNWVNGDSGPWQQQIATTGSTGSYSGKVQLPAADGEYTVSVGATPTMDSGGATLTTSWASDAVRLTGDSVTPKYFTYGQAGVATMKGTVQYKDTVSGWQPLAGTQVVVVAGSYDVKYIDADSAGHFTWGFVPDTNGTNWSIVVGGGNLLGSAQADGNVFDAVPVHFKYFNASLNPFAQLSVHACAYITAPGFFSPQGYMSVQYAAHPTGPWLYLGRVPYVQGTIPSSCGVNTLSYFAGTLNVRLASAYYRGYFPATPNYQTANSAAVHQAKTVTRIISLRVSPSSVSKNGNITVSGRLQRFTGSWHNLGGQQILIVLRPSGSKTWYWIKKVRTNSAGFFSGTVADPVTADWSAAYEGGGSYFASGGSIHHVTVTGAAAAAMLPALHALRLPPPG